MILTLTAVSLNDRPLTPALSARFDDHGGTIGRADHNTLALPDPERFISRLQAEVVASGSSFLIRNVGSANAILVGAQALSEGQSAVLRHGDEVRIGGYVLQTECAAVEHAASDVTRPSLPIAPRPALAAAPAAAPTPAAMAWAAPAPTRPAPLTPPPAPVSPSVSPSVPLSAPLSAPLPAPRSPPPPPPLPPLRAQAVTGLSGHNPFADLLGPGAGATASADPFADLFSPAPPGQAGGSGAAARRHELPAFQPAPAGIHEHSAALPTKPANAAAPALQRLPDDFDPFAAPPPPRAAPAAAPVDPFADLMPATPAAGIDQAFGLAGGSRQDDPLAHFLSDPGRPAGQAASTGLPTDPLMLFGAPPPAAAPAERNAPVQADHLPALHTAYAPPRVAVPPVAAPVRPAPVPRPQPTPPVAMAPPLRPAAPPPALSPAEGQDVQALWAAFCAGAGIDLPLPAGAGPERMQAIGMMLRAAVDGTLQLMAVRASTKHELRAAVTMIQQRHNNPLKFSPDAASAIEQLVQPPTRGFLDGPAALEEAMHDLVGHSIGTVAGMRAAIEGMLGRFDPAALEAKLAGGRMLDSLLPMNRRARLWDLYLQHHGAIREEAQEDFHNLFGKAFLAAYEQQIDRLRQDKQRR